MGMRTRDGVLRVSFDDYFLIEGCFLERADDGLVAMLVERMT